MYFDFLKLYKCVAGRTYKSSDDKRLNLGLLWIICWIFVVRKTSRVAYSFNYTEGGLLSLKAEWTKTATLKCWEHTAPARHEAPGAQNNKLISSFEHLWTWFCILFAFGQQYIDSTWTWQLHKPFLIDIQQCHPYRLSTQTTCIS